MTWLDRIVREQAAYYGITPEHHARLVNDAAVYQELIDTHEVEEPVTDKQPCRSPYCECTKGQCTHPGCYDARDVPETDLSVQITTHKVAVDADYFWQPMSTCPRGVKVQLLNPGGVAVYGTYDGKNNDWQGWAPLPKRRPA